MIEGIAVVWPPQLDKGNFPWKDFGWRFAFGWNFEWSWSSKILEKMRRTMAANGNPGSLWFAMEIQTSSGRRAAGAFFKSTTAGFGGRRTP